MSRDGDVANPHCCTRARYGKSGYWPLKQAAVHAALGAQSAKIEIAGADGRSENVNSDLARVGWLATQCLRDRIAPLH